MEVNRATPDLQIGENLMLTVGDLQLAVNNAKRIVSAALENGADRYASAVERPGVQSERTTRVLALWTKVMAFAVVVQAVATLVLRSGPD